ncbi:MAG: nodulation protein NodU, partial [Actinomycetota bacterium]|nr:nodulation protein NodU [Actinomycetota bacterium]
YNAGVTSAEFCRAARFLSDLLFDQFIAGAVDFLPLGLPLAVGGGCGLNCEWNMRLAAHPHFREVFVPPCPDDSGSAIGAAADAAALMCNSPRLRWDTYSGDHFVCDTPPDPGEWERCDLDLAEVVRTLQRGHPFAWIEGRQEIGPRALGHRSLIANASDASMKDVLNTMKGRESYRPVAPACLADKVGDWFVGEFPDPHMLYFRGIRDRSRIPAVAHADGTARVQTVTPSVGRLHDLLVTAERLTGIPIVCNTSLNHKGKGFINRLSELVSYANATGLNHIVVDGRWWARVGASSAN